MFTSFTFEAKLRSTHQHSHVLIQDFTGGGNGMFTTRNKLYEIIEDNNRFWERHFCSATYP